MALRSTATGSFASSGTPSVPVPAGVASGDDIILVLESDGGTLGTAPSGFALLASTANYGTDGETVGIYWKRATGADTGTYTWGALGSGGAGVTIALAYSGRDGTNSPVASAVNAQTISTAASAWAVSATGLTAVAGDDLVWIASVDFGSANVVNAQTPPTGFTAQISASGAGGFGGLAVATEDNVAAGATGTVTGTVTLSGSNTGQSRAYLIQIPALIAVSAVTPFIPHGMPMGV